MILVRLENIRLKYKTKNEMQGIDGSLFPSLGIINLRTHLPLNRKIACLIHEIGHCNCWNTKCKCMSAYWQSLGNKVYHSNDCEFHAYQYSLQTMMDNKWLGPLRYELEFIESLARQANPHQIVARKVIRTRLWKQCQRALRRQNSKVPQVRIREGLIEIR